jgi:hypothetical protein
VIAVDIVMSCMIRMPKFDHCSGERATGCGEYFTAEL